MAINCGFFNSVNKDRTYSAEDMTRPYELLVSNGVFATPQGTPSNYLQVYANTGMTVTVKAGRGLFKDKWFVSDSDLALTLDDAEVTLTRIDSIIVKIDTSETVREGTIEIKKGTPSSSAVAPSMERSDDVYEYRLADITIAPGVTSIAQLNIVDKRGSADCPWITSLIQQVDTSTLFEQWDDAFSTQYTEFEGELDDRRNEYDAQYDTFTSEFDTWFATIKETLSTATLIRSFESTYTTTTQDETVIPIGIPQFNKELDILQVYINGLLLVKGDEYTLDSNTQITLTNGVDPGTKISFVVYKSIDGSSAETVVQQVYDLQTQVNAIEETYLPLEGGTVLGDLTVNGTIRSNGSQVAHTDGVTNMQFGTTNLDTRINAKDDIYLTTRCQSLSIVPIETDTYQIGNATNRYTSIYLTSNPNVSSDRRLKQDIQDTNADDLMEFIDKLRVVTYAYKNDPQTERIGLIAQEVEEAGGSKYVEIDENGMYGLKAADLVYPLISAVQTLSKRVEELEKKLGE